MVSLKSRLATGLGLVLFVGGIGILTLGIPTRRGIGYELFFGQGTPIPGWAFALSFVSGPLLVLGGAVIGMRYGHFERYHKRYDPETGSIDSGHPFGTLQEYVSKADGTPNADEDHPPKFVMARRHLAVSIGITVGVPLVYSSLVLDFPPMLHQMLVIVLGGGGFVLFFAIDHLFQQEDIDYDASW